MTWRDDLLVGSIGGVPFFFEVVEHTLGRDTVIHEFHGDRQAWVEDNGTATKRWTIDIFLIGPTYNLTREALEGVFNTPGPYEFQDPFRGGFDVRTATPPVFRETRREGGMVRIARLELVEAGQQFPLVLSGPGKLTELAAAAAAALAAGTKFSLSGAIDKVLGSITSGIFAASSLLRTVNGKIGAKLNAIDQISAQLNEFERGIAQLKNTPQALMSSLTGLGLSIMGVIGSFKPDPRTVEVEEPVFPLVGIASESTNDLATFVTAPEDIPWVPDDSEQSVIDDNAHEAITINMQGTGVIGGADISGQIEFQSAQQAGDYLAQLTAGFESVMSEPTLDPDTYQAMAALRAATIRQLIDRQAELPRVVIITPPTVLPALVLSWELYGTPDRALEIVRRNGLKHPGFVPSAPLEVLADA